MYPVVLWAHGAWRWVVLAAGVAAVASACRGLLRRAPFEPRARRFARFFSIAIDIQVLMGAVLYLVLSPLSTAALELPDAMAAGSDLRFFGMTHGMVMMGAFVAVHGAATLIRRAPTDRSRHRRAILSYGIVLALLLAGIPWWRPWLRL